MSKAISGDYRTPRARPRKGGYHHHAKEIASVMVRLNERAEAHFGYLEHIGQHEQALILAVRYYAGGAE